MELGNFMVNLFPVCKLVLITQRSSRLITIPLVRHVPVWFPFANFRKIGARWREKMLTVVNTPFDMVKADMVS